MTFILQTLSGMKTALSFILHLLAIGALYAMAIFKGIDTSNLIMLTALSYGGTQTAKQISAHVNASKDPNCSTEKVVEEVNDK